MNKSKIGLQLFSVRDEIQADMLDTLKKVKSYGYGAVEFAGLYGNDPAEVRKMCEEIGLVPLSAHVPMGELMADLEGTLDKYQTVGCKYIVIPSMPVEYRADKENFRDVFPIFKKIGEAVNNRGMVLQYHNHDFEFVKIDGEYYLDILYKEVGPELLQTQLDTCWVNVGGENPAEYLKKYAGRIPTVHLKDFAGRRSENMYVLIGVDDEKKNEVSGEFELRPLGKGLNNFPAIIKAGDQYGTEWYIVEQDRPSMGYTPLESVKISANYLLNEIEV